MSSFQDGKSARYYLESDIEDLTTESIDGTTFVDAVKVAHNHNVHIANKTINGGLEDAIDCVGVVLHAFDNLTVYPYGKNGITVKGASRNVLFTSLFIGMGGDDTDIVLGDFDNYWYPGRPSTQGIFFTGKGRDPNGLGIKAKVKIIDAIDYGFDFPVEVEVVPKWKWLPYFYYRYYLLKLYNVFGAKIDNSPYLPGGLTKA